MTRREKLKSSLSLLNSLNEEDDESSVHHLDDSFLNVNKSEPEQYDRSIEQHRLRVAIEGVFKPSPQCELNDQIDDNKQRLQSLTHCLLERLVLTSQDLQTQQKTVQKSSASFSDYLSTNFINKQRIITNEPIEHLNEAVLSLTNLSLTNECLKEFNVNKLISSNQTEQMTINKNFQEIKSINLSGNSFNLVPLNLIGLFANLELIDLSENNFESISLTKLSKFTNLKEINMSSNLLKSIKLYMDDNEEEQNRNNDLSTNVLFTVERLNLANNQLNSTTSLIVTQFRNLKYLNLANNDFQLNAQSVELQLPWQKANSYLKGLLELNFSKNNKKQTMRKADSTKLLGTKIISLPYFDSLISLRVLDLSENNLYNMPNDIKELRNLEELNLDFNFLEFLPIELTELRKLRVLSACSNRISELSLTFCSFARFRDTITKINLSRNQLKDESFTYKIAIFENLKELNLSHNLFELMPNPLPPSLEELNLNNNKIKSLMIRPLSQLALNDDDVMQVLDLEDKKFRPKAAATEPDYKNLEDETAAVRKQSPKKKKNGYDERIYDEPDIDKLDSIELPHVFYLRNLKRLHLRDNHLGEIPPDFGILNSNLEFLDLGFNLLHEINVSLCRGLAYLKYLDLTSNRIRQLPDKLRELSDLEYLDLSKNRLHLLSNELCNDLKNLKELNLSHNCLEHLYLIVNSSGQQSKSSLSRTSRHTSGSSEHRLKIEYAKFSFNLPNLKKINLSNNHLNSTVSLYRSFALSSQLTEIDLSNNRLTSIEVDNIEEKESITMAFNKECIFDEEKIKRLTVPKHRLFELELINLSHNFIEIQARGGFTKLLCNLYKLAPNLTVLQYDQKSGLKLGSFIPELTQVPKISVDSLAPIIATQIEEDNDYCFEINENDYFILNEKESLSDKSELMELLNSKLRPEFYDALCSKLKSIDLSNNNLKKLPSLVYKLKSLKEIYFNGNLLKKIPNELYKRALLDQNDEEFENLKKIQQKAELLRKKSEEAAAAAASEDEEQIQEKEEEEEEIVEKKKKKKKKNKDIPPQIEAIDKAVLIKQPDPLLADQLEILQLNSNQIEQVPNNLFSQFKQLREIKLNDNPLNNPPQHSVCVSAKLTRNQEFTKPKLISEPLQTTLTLIQPQSNFMRSSSSLDVKISLANQTDKKLNLPNLFFETTETLKPLQSYMFNHKKREDMLLCNMFLIIKDNIDSLETLMKLLRRLKMPMDRCEYVCTEITNSVSKNWSKIAAVEYPPEPGKLGLSRKELNKKMQQYILKLQAWNLLNAWRNMYGADAHTDELIRILKLMNSNNYENDLFEKIYKLKYKSNSFRV